MKAEDPSKDLKMSSLTNESEVMNVTSSHIDIGTQKKMTDRTENLSEIDNSTESPGKVSIDNKIRI